VIRQLLCATLVLTAALQARSVLAIGIDAGGNVSGAFGLSEEDARFFPGTYFFRKGCEAYRRGRAEEALDLWRVAASWGQKSAQYNLGIAYFRGEDVGRDVPLGLAWLGLAAERHHPVFQESLDAAWYQSTVEERIAGKRRFTELKSSYGDEVALRRALRRYEEERRNLTGSHLGAVGALTIHSANSPRGQNGALYLDELQREADVYFDPGTGSVNVGDLIPLTDESVSAPARK
jgi:hypothetical protein